VESITKRSAWRTWERGGRLHWKWHIRKTNERIPERENSGRGGRPWVGQRKKKETTGIQRTVRKREGERRKKHA